MDASFILRWSPIITLQEQLDKRTMRCGSVCHQILVDKTLTVSQSNLMLYTVSCQASSFWFWCTTSLSFCRGPCAGGLYTLCELIKMNRSSCTGNIIPRTDAQPTARRRWRICRSHDREIRAAKLKPGITTTNLVTSPNPWPQRGGFTHKYHVLAALARNLPLLQNLAW